MVSNKQINKIILDRIVENIEKDGILPWNKPWNASPLNGVSKKEYRGINKLLLGSLGYELPYFFTGKQIHDKGAMILKGKKGIPIVFWKIFKYEDKEKSVEGKKSIKSVPFLRYSNVWNIEDTTIDKTDYIKEIVNEHKDGEEIINSYLEKEGLQTKISDHASYVPSQDYFNMPHRNTFNGTNEYYSTYFHEIIHSTGHEKRLKREGIINKSFFGDELYSKEELVAEIGACFLRGYANIDSNSTFNNSISYLKSWLSEFKKDEGLLLKCAGLADKAFDYVLNGKKEIIEENLTEENKEGNEENIEELNINEEEINLDN